MRPPADVALLLRVPTLVAAVAVLVAGVAGAAGPLEGTAEGWQGLLGVRPAPALGGRWIVVFDAPSLADKMRVAGGVASEAQQKRWTAAAQAAQDRFLTRLAAHGAGFTPEQRYTRVLNAVSAALDPRVLPVLDAERFVVGVYPVRAAYPAALSANPSASPLSTGTQPDIGIPGFDGSGVEIALIDTGVDLGHPYIAPRLLPGIDIVDPGSDASARQSPTERGRIERHGTELAGIVAGIGGPARIHGMATGAQIRPVRVAGWQPDGTGGVSVYARTDQVIAGLEAAVDPNADGDAHDAARIALVGVVEPFASFEDSPLQRAAAGAAVLDMLVVAPAGNDGPAGPTYGSVGAPGGAATALAVAALDSRRRGPAASVVLRAGLDVLLFGGVPLGGTAKPRDALDLPVVVVLPPPKGRVATGSALDRLFDAGGFSRVAGRAAMLPAGPPTPEAVRDLAQAGARAVLVDGPVPGGALGIDDREEIPIIGVPTAVATRVRRSVRDGVPVRLAVGAARLEQNPGQAELAPFSSEGLAFDGTPKPDLAAPGVALRTAAAGRTPGGSARYGSVSGSSAAAAVVAGAAAVLAQARPDLGAAGLKAALIGSARPLSRSPAAVFGVVDPEAAAARELLADPPRVALGVAFSTGAVLGRGFSLRNTSKRLISAVVAPLEGTGGTLVTVYPTRVSLRPGQSVEIGVSVSVEAMPAPPAALGGTILVTPDVGDPLRVPWVVALPELELPLIERAAVQPPSFRPSDTSPAVLTFTAGRVDGTASRPVLLPLRRVEVKLVRSGRRIGDLLRLRDVLPGRYALGITGRGPKGARLGPGEYELRIVAWPVTGDTPEWITVPFTIEEPT
jgi:subtilisin family serine protease